MENGSFHSQLLSVMEVLAKAAVAEINRRVDESCAVLRLEVSQSRRDIDLLKGKCEVMEAELRRTRMRARRKDPESAQEVKTLLEFGAEGSNKDAEAQSHTQQRADMEPVTEAEHILIKEECAEEDMWKNDAEDKLIAEAEQTTCFEASHRVQTDSFVEHLRSTESPADAGFPDNTFPEQQLNRNQNEAELIVKPEREEEPDENAAPLDSAHKFVAEEGDGQLWSSSLSSDAADPSFSYDEQQFEPLPAVFPSQSGLHLEDVVPRIHSVGKSHSVVVSAARVKRRARTFGCKRPQPDEGHNTLSADQCSIPQQSQHQYRDSAPHTRNPNEDLTPPNPAASSLCGHSRSSFGLARRMRTPWRSEKRFSCSYCNKSFVRISQLKEHLRSHTGEKPFSCMQCGRSFTKQCNLYRHAVVHSGEKPHKCSLCGKCFTQRSSLKSHQKTAH